MLSFTSTLAISCCILQGHAEEWQTDEWALDEEAGLSLMQLRAHQKPVADHRAEVSIEFRGPSNLREDEIAKIIRGWTFWGSGADAPFLDFITEDSCNLVLGTLPIKGVKPVDGYDVWCGKANYEKLATMWTQDSEHQAGQEVGDLVPPPVVVVGNMVVFEEDWEGGPDVNGGQPVKETVVMTLNADHQVTNVVYGLDNVQVAANQAAEAAGQVHEAAGAGDFNIHYIGASQLDANEVKKIIHGWTYWGSGDSSPFLDFVSGDMCNLVLGPLKVGGVEFHGDVTSWCGRANYEQLAAGWVAASEAASGSEIGDVSPPAVKVIGNLVVFEEDWKGGPAINGGQPVHEDVVMVIDPATHKVTNVIYGVDRSSIAAA